MVKSLNNSKEMSPAGDKGETNVFSKVHVYSTNDLGKNYYNKEKHQGTGGLIEEIDKARGAGKSTMLVNKVTSLGGGPRVYSTSTRDLLTSGSDRSSQLTSSRISARSGLSSKAFRD